MPAQTIKTKLTKYVVIVLWILGPALVLLTLTGTALFTHVITAALPGINYDPAMTESIVETVLIAALVGPLLVLSKHICSTKDAKLRNTLRTAARRTYREFRLVLIALGLRKYSRSELLQMSIICAASIAFFAILGGWLSHVPLPPGWAASPDDARGPAIAQATPFIQGIHGFIHAPLWEELLFRGPIALTLFFLNSGAATRHLNKTVSVSLLIAVATVSTVLFGAAHAPYNGLNVALAGGFGAVAVLTTIRYRSLLPGLVIHAFYNTITTFL